MTLSMEVEPLVLTVPVSCSAAGDSLSGAWEAGAWDSVLAAGDSVVVVVPPPQPASMPTHRAADSIRARVLFFMSFNLQSCNGFVSPWNAIQYIGRL